MEHKAIRRMALSERITDETRRQVKESFPELNEMCQLSVKRYSSAEAYRAFGDALFLSLAEPPSNSPATIRSAPGRLSPSALKPCGTPCMRRTHNDAGNTASLRSPYRPDLPVYRHCLPFGPEYDVFKVDGRIFMITMTIRGRALVNLKAEPQKIAAESANHCRIEPGYHMNKKHWITVVPGEDISEDICWPSSIDDSWHQVVNKLSKKAQQRRVRADFQPNAISVIAFFTLIICDFSLYSSSPNAP